MIAWEKEHRPLGPGDVVLFMSGYSDAYYKPLPQGRRYAALPLAKESPAWPDPDPDCMEYLAGRKVMTLGTDSTSMGPLARPGRADAFRRAQARDDLDRERHRARRAAADRRLLLHVQPQVRRRRLRRRPCIRRGRRPARPASDRFGQEEKRRRSVGRARGRPAGRHGQAREWAIIASRSSRSSSASIRTHDYLLTCTCSTATRARTSCRRHTPCRMRDSTIASYAPEVQEWLAEYEKKYGRRGTSDVTTEQGADRPDVRAGAGDRRAASRGHERLEDVAVLAGDYRRPTSRTMRKRTASCSRATSWFFTAGWTDRFMRPLPLGKACLEDPLNGASEGWPAPGPDAICLSGGTGKCAASPPTRRLWAASSPSVPS